MGLLSRSIFREVCKSAVFGSVLFTFVLFLQRAGKLFAILVRSSAPPATVAQLFALAIPFTLTFTASQVANIKSKIMRNKALIGYSNSFAGIANSTDVGGSGGLGPGTITLVNNTAAY